MELLSALKIGWLNGWLPLGLLVLVEGLLLLASPKDVRARLFDRSGWSRKQAGFTVVGKLFSLVCLVLIVFTPLKIDSSVFIVGLVLYLLGLVGLVMAIMSFRNTPIGQPVTRGPYTVSRHPQIVMLFVAFLGICLLIGSWLAVLALVMSKVFQHYGILAEEEVCLAQYSEPYRDYMKRVPRYFLFF